MMCVGVTVCVCVCACVWACACACDRPLAQFVYRSLKLKHCVFRMPPITIIKKVKSCAPV